MFPMKPFEPELNEHKLNLQLQTLDYRLWELEEMIANERSIQLITASYDSELAILHDKTIESLEAQYKETLRKSCEIQGLLDGTHKMCQQCKVVEPIAAMTQVMTWQLEYRCPLCIDED